MDSPEKILSEAKRVALEHFARNPNGAIRHLVQSLGTNNTTWAALVKANLSQHFKEVVATRNKRQFERLVNMIKLPEE